MPNRNVPRTRSAAIGRGFPGRTTSAAINQVVPDQKPVRGRAKGKGHKPKPMRGQRSRR